MAYNADLFAKAGLKTPEPTWDWKQYQELAQRLTTRQADAPVWGTHILPSSSEIFYWTWMYGGEPFTPKEEPAQAGSRIRLPSAWARMASGSIRSGW